MVVVVVEQLILIMMVEQVAPEEVAVTIQQ
jgi:hypothetical protein